jgi:glycerol transport system ATP-binding protein
MTRGRVVQLGSPEALFERPAHRFVGHFIGSPGMNFLPDGDRTLGIRPEYVTLHPPGTVGTLAATVQRVQDIGTYTVVTCETAGQGGPTVKVRLPGEAPVPMVGEAVGLQVRNAHTCFYGPNEELVA